MISINQALKETVGKLEGIATTPLLDAQVLLSNVLQKDRLYIILNGDKILTKDEYNEYNKMIDLRLQGVPVQYIVKKQEFMGLDFMVDKGVLIPRPDTEILVEKVLSHIKKDKEYRIIDIGTGSGAITVSLAKYIEKSYVYSVDISEKAIEIAKTNAEKHGVLSKINFLQGSLFEPIENIGIKGKIDILVSNPPYIPSKDIENLQVEVSKYEPKIALDGGEDGLDFYRKIIYHSRNYLKKGGYIALEVGHDQAQRVKEIMESYEEYVDIEITKDLAGIDRVVSGTYNY